MERNQSSAPEILTPEQTEVIQELVNCALACEACASSSINEKESMSMTRCIELARDCSEICFQASRLIMRRSEIAEHYIVLVEEICRVTADECEKHQDDPSQICAEACKSCADSCATFHQHLTDR
jgi:hypothetical protein